MKKHFFAMSLFISCYNLPVMGMDWILNRLNFGNFSDDQSSKNEKKPSPITTTGTIDLNKSTVESFSETNHNNDSVQSSNSSFKKISYELEDILNKANNGTQTDLDETIVQSFSETTHNNDNALSSNSNFKTINSQLKAILNKANNGSQTDLNESIVQSFTETTHSNSNVTAVKSSLTMPKELLELLQKEDLGSLYSQVESDKSKKIDVDELIAAVIYNHNAGKQILTGEDQTPKETDTEGESNFNNLNTSYKKIGLQLRDLLKKANNNNN